jgi:protein-disulfide isomerase
MNYSVSARLTRIGFIRLRVLVLAILSLTALQPKATVYAQDQDKIVAVVNGNKITQRQLDASVTAQLFPLQQQIYAIRMAALEGLIQRTILESEAKKRGISVDELRKQLTAGAVTVSEAEVEKLYTDNASTMGAMAPDEAKERLRLDLESQARMKNYRTALLHLRSTATVDLNLEEPALTISLNDHAPSIGPQRAIVTITEFSDFQCPYCRGVQEVLKQILKAYPDEVKLVFRNLPLDIHAEAFPSAQAAVCAGEQGLFWKYHDALFGADDLGVESLNKLAVDQGLNLQKFKTCVASDASREVVRVDIREARRFGFDGTPTFVVNGKVARGAMGFEEFKAVIERELRIAQKTAVNSR